MKIEEIEKLCKEATPGPWDVYCIALENFRIKCREDFDGFVNGKDATFIASSRTLIPKLLAVAKAAKASLKNAALICDEDIILEKALEELEKE